MDEEKMTFIDRLINPARVECGALDEKPTEADLALAAATIENLSTSLKELIGIYWGEGDGQEPPPACIQRAMAVLVEVQS